MSSCSQKIQIDVLLLYEKILPDHFELVHNIGKYYFNNYHYNYAILYLERAVLLSPEESDVLTLAKSLRYSSKFKAALPYYLLAEARGSQDEFLFSDIAYCYQEIKQHALAIEYYEKANALKPNTTWIIGNIGWNYQHLKKYDKALEYHHLYESLDPKDTWNLDNLGFCYWRKKQYQKGKDYYEKSLSLNSQNAWCLRQMGWCYIFFGDIPKARECFENALKIKAEMSEFSMMNMGHVYLCLREKAEAMKYYRQSALAFRTLKMFVRDLKEDFQYLQAQGIGEEEYSLICEELVQYRLFNKKGKRKDTSD